MECSLALWGTYRLVSCFCVALTAMVVRYEELAEEVNSDFRISIES